MTGLPDIDDATLLEVWSGVADLDALGRSVALVALLETGGDAGAAEAVTVGRGQRAMLEARRRWFGDVMASVAGCPQCAETVELAVQVGDLLDVPVPEGTVATTLLAPDVAVTCRQPSFGDLLAAAATGTEGAARLLARRCIVEVTAQGRAGSWEELGAAELDAVAESVEDADPIAVIRLDIACPACGHAWQAVLDVAEHLWTDIEHRARVTLDQVARLAVAYGWTEADVLRLPPRQRLAYLEAAGT